VFYDYNLAIDYQGLITPWLIYSPASHNADMARFIINLVERLHFIANYDTQLKAWV
jgi:hypothetical protein